MEDLNLLIQRIREKMEVLDSRLRVMESGIWRHYSRRCDGGSKGKEIKAGSEKPSALVQGLKERGNYFDYAKSFVELASKMVVPEEEQVQLFVEGLTNPNHKLISVLNPRTLQQAVAYGRALSTDIDFTATSLEGTNMVKVLRESDGSPEKNEPIDVSLVMKGKGWKGNLNDDPKASKFGSTSSVEGLRRPNDKMEGNEPVLMPKAREDRDWSGNLQLQNHYKTIERQNHKALLYQPPHKRLNPVEEKETNDNFRKKHGWLGFSKKDNREFELGICKEDNKKGITALSPTKLQQTITPARTLTLEGDPYTSIRRARDQSVNLVHPESDSTHDVIYGVDQQQIKEIKRDRELISRSPETLKRLEVVQPMSIWIYGMTGNRKTLLATIVVKQAEDTFNRRFDSEWVQEYTEEESRMINELFVMAKKLVPSITFMGRGIGEIEAARMETRSDRGGSYGVDGNGTQGLGWDGEMQGKGDSLTTHSDRKGDLRIWTPAQDVPEVAQVWYSLKAAMKGNEEIFDRGMISACLQTASEDDYAAILGIIDHENSYNWIDNRATGQDWFQLILKESFTVFRDQEFPLGRDSKTMQRMADDSRWERPRSTNQNATTEKKSKDAACAFLFDLQAKYTEPTFHSARQKTLFQIDDWVYVKFHPYKQGSVRGLGNNKFWPLHYGPYCVRNIVGEVDSKLKPPEQLQFRSTSPISNKSLNPRQSASKTLPNVVNCEMVPECFLTRRIVMRVNQAATRVMGTEVNRVLKAATWKILFDLLKLIQYKEVRWRKAEEEKREAVSEWVSGLKQETIMLEMDLNEQTLTLQASEPKESNKDEQITFEGPPTLKGREPIRRNKEGLALASMRVEFTQSLGRSYWVCKQVPRCTLGDKGAAEGEVLLRERREAWQVELVAVGSWLQRSIS